MNGSLHSSADLPFRLARNYTRATRAAAGGHASIGQWMDVFVDNRVLQCDVCFASCVFLLSFLFLLKLVLFD